MRLPTKIAELHIPLAYQRSGGTPNMRTALIFPWRPTDDRLQAFQVTKELVPSFYDFDFILTVDSGHPIFNRSASRNYGVHLATLRNVDVVVVCDADSVPQKETLKAAIAAAPDGLMHFPFHEAWYINEKGMIRVRQNATTEQIRSRIYDKCNSEGGVWVCRPETWWKAGGQDPRLANWGCDDRAFLAASRTLVGMPVKHDGFLYCLPHTRPSEGEIWIPEEVQVMVEYQEAYGDQEKMKKLLSPNPVQIENPIVRFLKGD